IVVFILLSCAPAAASSILDGWAVNLDGVFTSFNQFGPSDVTSLPPNVDGSGFDMGTVDLPDGNPDAGTGTGTITMSFQGAGPHMAIIWLDLHIDDGTPVYWNEFGDTVGDPAPGQSWQIDEPGYGSLGYT